MQVQVAAQQSGVQRVLAFLLEEQDPVTRPLVASACALSRPTVFAAVQQLESLGLVAVTGQQSGSPGRSATLYEVATGAGILAAVDIGGSNLRVAITDLRGKLLAEGHEPTAKAGGPAITKQAIDLVHSVLKSSEAAGATPTRVAVSVPGVVGADGSTVHYASNIDQFTAFDSGFVFQGANLVPFLTAKENLLVVADLAGNKGKPAERRALILLDELGLAHRVDNLPGQISGGERQRVAIGRALMNKPEPVLFDEPTSALDTKLGEQVMQLIRDEVKGRGTAAIVVTHDTRMTHYADRVVEISDGRLAAERFRARPSHRDRLSSAELSIAEARDEVVVHEAAGLQNA